MVRRSTKKRFSNLTLEDLHRGLTNLAKKMRKVNCPECLSVIILEFFTSEGDVILCPRCDAKLVVSSFNRRLTVHSIGVHKMT